MRGLLPELFYETEPMSACVRGCCLFFFKKKKDKWIFLLQQHCVLSPGIQKLSFLEKWLILETREHEKLQVRAACCCVTPLDKRERG